MPIARISKGAPPTLLSPKKANELIDAINAVELLQVRPAGMGKALVTKTNIIIDLSQIQTTLAAIIGSPPGAPSGSPPSITNNLTTVNNNITNINNKLATGGTVSATGTCNPDGTMTVTGTVTFS